MVEANPCHYEDYQVTNEQGVWEKFLPGGDCTGLYAFAVPPAGFQSTNTPAARACSAEFGFVQEGTVVKNRFPTSAQFASREKTTALLGQLAIAIVVARSYELPASPRLLVSAQAALPSPARRLISRPLGRLVRRAHRPGGSVVHCRTTRSAQ